MKRAIFPGTFDPFTVGHFSVVKRALTFMDELVIGIGINEGKRTWFPVEKRVEMVRRLYENEPRVRVEAYEDLTIDFAQRMEAQFIVRGIRTVKDFEYEETIADINRQLSGHRNDSSVYGTGTYQREFEHRTGIAQLWQRYQPFHSRRNDY